MFGGRRLEIIVVALIMVGAAFYARNGYIPPYPDRQVEIAEEKYDLDVGSPGAWFSAWSSGDGVAYAVIAADPSGMKLSVEVKEPAYRYTRAGYGWAAWAASLGQERWVPYGLALIGALSLAGMFALAVRLRDRLGPGVWLLVLNPAIYLGLAGDTAEPMALLLLALGIAGSSVWAAAALGVTRPSYLVAMVGRWRPLAAGALSLALLLVYAYFRFGADQFVPGGGRIALPLVAYVADPSLFAWLVAAMGAFTLYQGARRRDWAWVVTGLLVLSLGDDVVANPINAWRAAGMIPVLWAFGPGYRAGEPSTPSPPTLAGTGT